MPSPTDTTSDSNHVIERAITLFPTDPGEQDTFLITQVESAVTDVVPIPAEDSEGNSGIFFKIGGTHSTEDSFAIELGARRGGDGSPIHLSGL